MKIELSSLLLFLIVFQSILLVIFIVTARKFTLSNILFSFCFLLIGINFFSNFLSENNVHFDFLMLASCNYGLVYAPLIYLYVRSVLYKDFKFRFILSLHFMPFVVGLLSGFGENNFCSLLVKVSFVSIFIYIVISVRLWFIYRKTLIRTTSTPDPHKYRWIQSMLFFFIFIIIVNLCQHIFKGIYLGNIYIPLHYFTHLLMLTFVIFAQYQSLTGLIWLRKISSEDSILLKPKKIDKTEEKYTEDLQQIELLLQNEKLFLEPNLTIKELAEKMEWSPRKISIIINSASGTNFSDYINRMRIEEACNRFINPKDKKETISEVLFDCGFNSRSVFNSLFKLYTGHTPSSYKKRHIKI